MKSLWFVYLLLVCVESYNCTIVAKKSPEPALNVTQPDAATGDRSKPEIPSVALSESGAIVKAAPSLAAPIEGNLATANQTLANANGGRENSHSRGVTNTSDAVAPSAKQPQPEPGKESLGRQVPAAGDSPPSIPVHEDNRSDEVPAAAKPIANNSTMAAKPANQTAIVTPKVDPAKNATSTAGSLPSATNSIEVLKPNVTVSVEDSPQMMAKFNGAEQPVVQSSREVDPLLLGQTDRHPYAFLFPAIAIIVAVPLLVMFTNCTVRQARDCWSKRKYRRMDYLIEEMYN